jgi:hypothetical protein
MTNEELLFMPVTCATCNRISVVPLSKQFVQGQLRSGAPVNLFCAFDDITWRASHAELARLQKLLHESEQVAKSPWLRLRQSSYGSSKMASPPFSH